MSLNRMDWKNFLNLFSSAFRKHPGQLLDKIFSEGDLTCLLRHGETSLGSSHCAYSMFMLSRSKKEPFVLFYHPLCSPWYIWACSFVNKVTFISYPSTYSFLTVCYLTCLSHLNICVAWWKEKKASKQPTGLNLCLAYHKSLKIVVLAWCMACHGVCGNGSPWLCWYKFLLLNMKPDAGCHP